jgi:hypothetical protein
MSHPAENDAPHHFGAGDLKYLGHLSEKVEALTEWYGARLVVAVWDKGDQRPIAWVECHPGDSDATVRFGPEPPDEDTPFPPA